jgi:hypothetical protein
MVARYYQAFADIYNMAQTLALLSDKLAAIDRHTPTPIDRLALDEIIHASRGCILRGHESIRHVVE